MKILSLFDGMSVAQQALKELNKDVEVYYASEIDKYAIAVTHSNFPKTKQLGSVVGLKVDWQPELLVGGSPCQDLSIANKDRKGLDGSRSGLFWEYVRILNEVKPKYFILENVASMTKANKDLISNHVGVEPIMIDAKLTSAQSRKRLFWVGKLNGNSYEQVQISQPEDQGIYLKDILEDRSKAEDITERIKLKKEGTLAFKKAWSAVRTSEQKSKTLTAGGQGISNSGATNILVNGKYYKPTTTEALRLQSMPDDYFDKAIANNKPISNTQRYKMCGNAFNCEVVKHIIKHLEI